MYLSNKDDHLETRRRIVGQGAREKMPRCESRYMRLFLLLFICMNHDFNIVLNDNEIRNTISQSL